MKKVLLTMLISLSGFFSGAKDSDSLMFRKIYSEILTNSPAHDWLRTLTKEIGARLSGSPQAAKAVDWAYGIKKSIGADTVYLQEVWVPHWERGKKETGKIIDKNNNAQEVPVLATGGSVATPAAGVTAPVIEIKNLEELKILGREKVEGKIVFFNYPFDESRINTFGAYSDAGKYRWSGPSEAARYGAVASLTRSITNARHDHPHTGAMTYIDSLPKIPCATLSTNAADLLGRVLRSSADTRFFLQLNCIQHDSLLSYNVIGELRGTEFPEEIITVGGHLDSWDVGEGAHDDGAGIVQSMEVLRVFKALGYKPKRTIRVVSFMNEENGLRGGKKYADQAAELKERHVCAIESDAGAFTPYGFGLDMTKKKQEKVRSWSSLFRPYLIWNFDMEYGGADIGPLKKLLGTPLMGLAVDSQRYFDFHHAETDVFEAVNKRELLLGAAAMAAMTYMLSEHGL